LFRWTATNSHPVGTNIAGFDFGCATTVSIAGNKNEYKVFAKLTPTTPGRLRLDKDNSAALITWGSRWVSPASYFNTCKAEIPDLLLQYWTDETFCQG
jgi:hypothetical protein